MSKRILRRTCLNWLYAIIMGSIVGLEILECRNNTSLAIGQLTWAKNWNHFEAKFCSMARSIRKNVIIFNPSPYIEVPSPFQGFNNIERRNQYRAAKSCAARTNEYSSWRWVIPKIWKVICKINRSFWAAPRYVLKPVFCPGLSLIRPFYLNNTSAVWRIWFVWHGERLFSTEDECPLGIYQGAFCDVRGEISGLGGDFGDSNLPFTSFPQIISGYNKPISDVDEKPVKKSYHYCAYVRWVLKHPFFERLFWLGIVPFSLAAGVAFLFDPLRPYGSSKNECPVKKRSENDSSE